MLVKVELDGQREGWKETILIFFLFDSIIKNKTKTKVQKIIKYWC